MECSKCARPFEGDLFDWFMAVKGQECGLLRCPSCGPGDVEWKPFGELTGTELEAAAQAYHRRAVATIAQGLKVRAGG